MRRSPGWSGRATRTSSRTRARSIAAIVQASIDRLAETVGLDGEITPEEIFTNEYIPGGSIQDSRDPADLSDQSSGPLGRHARK